MKMKKIIVFAVALSMLFTGLLAAVGGEATDGGERVIESLVGNESEATEIYDWHDLDAIRDELDGNYVLMDDLDENTEGYDELVDTEEGWDPIGEFDIEEDFEFNGTFDGRGYEIRDQKIHRSEELSVGLFGATEQKAEITDLEVVSPPRDKSRGILTY